MWNQIYMLGVPWLALLPSLVLAVICPSLSTTGVSLDASRQTVSWSTGTSPSCLKGYMLCWNQTVASGYYTCDFETARTGSMKLTGLAACLPFSVNVKAYTRYGLASAPRILNGTADPPRITSMAVTQQDRNLTILSWPSLASYICVQKINFSLCNNRTEEASTDCWISELSYSVTKIGLRDLAVCRTYYVKISTISAYQTVSKTFTLRLNSINEVTNVKAWNVTQTSAAVEWWVSDVNTTCQATERMSLCYSSSSSSNSSRAQVCYSWTLSQNTSSDVRTLGDLDACTAYSVVVALKTPAKRTNRTVTFTTPLAADAIKAGVSAARNGSALVTWQVRANSTDCRPTWVMVCLAEARNGLAANCRTTNPGLRSSISLVGLAACTRYLVSLTVLTTTKPQPYTTLQFLTSTQGTAAMAYMSLALANSSVVVSWVPLAAGLPCVTVYNVSWSTSTGDGAMWRAVDSSRSSYTISPISLGVTYNVTVQAVFAGGDSQTLSGQISTSISGSSRSISELSPVLIMLAVISFQFMK